MRGRSAARTCCIWLLACLGLAPFLTGRSGLAGPLPSATSLLQLERTRGLVVEVAKKRRHKSRSRTQQDEPEPSTLAPGPNDRLIAGAGAQALLKPLTPAETYRVGQSLFFALTIGRHKGARAKTATVTIYGDVAGVVVPDAKGISAKTKDGRAAITVPLGGTNHTFTLELKLRQPANLQTAGQTLTSQMHIALGTDAKDAAVREAVLAFPLMDCATAYHNALGRLHAERQASLDNAVKSATIEDESLPGAWLFHPRKLSKAELEPALAVIAPPKRECRWAIDTVSFSTKKQQRLCKKWELVEVAVAPAGPTLPMVDEARAQAINKRAGIFIESRTAARDFAKSGKLEWISKRILTDVKSYLQQEPHPALCAGVDIMTSYFVDNAATLRKELATSDQSLIEAREIATTRLAALAMVLGKPPQDPEETASISLVTVARAAPVEAAGTSAELIAEVSRLLLPESQRALVEREPRSLMKLVKLRDFLATGLPRSEAEQRLVADALTAVEAATYLDAAAERYSLVGDAIFGSISAIKTAHGENCTCAP